MNEKKYYLFSVSLITQSLDEQGNIHTMTSYVFTEASAEKLEEIKSSNPGLNQERINCFYPTSLTEGLPIEILTPQKHLQLVISNLEMNNCIIFDECENE
jgi:hypothetical protein